MKTRGEEIAGWMLSGKTVDYFAIAKEIDDAINKAYIRGVQCGHIVSKHRFKDILYRLNDKISSEAFYGLMEETEERAF